MSPAPAGPSSSSSSTAAAASSSSSSSAMGAHSNTFDSIEDTVAAIARGEFVIVLDDEDRENEGDLIIAADKVTTEQMAWFIKHTSGFICISLHPSRIASLEIPMMVPNNTEKNKTAYTVTLDYKHGTTTGISAHDRALTSRMLADETLGAKPDDFTRPGHLNPLRYTEGGVRRRGGHTEASVDLCIAAGLPPAALLCELVDPSDDKGNIAARDSCFVFAREHNLRITTIEKLKSWREGKEGELPKELVVPEEQVNGAAAAAQTTTKTEGSNGKAENGQEALDEERGVKRSIQEVAEPKWEGSEPKVAAK